SPGSEAAASAGGDAGVSNGADSAVAGGSVFEPAPPGADAAGLTAGGDYASGPVVHERDPGSYPARGDVPNTRRRSVVFEEDDELDVPDFLK
ncbi:MAG TPA: cell division protein FtsZ, partial [Streptosporangiaceae bacterium]|nr:cell division protein FtsZ [Streptosporangiaceae bacterium]